MDTLPVKVRLFTKMIKQSLWKKDAIALMSELINHYGISKDELFDAAKTAAQQVDNVHISRPSTIRKTERFKVIDKVGVVLPSNKILYYDGSEDCGSRAQARSFVGRLPSGYNWHIMTKAEFEEIMELKPDIDNALRKMGGLAMCYPEREYLLGDNSLDRGYVRYVANL